MLLKALDGSTREIDAQKVRFGGSFLRAFLKEIKNIKQSKSPETQAFRDF